MSCGQREAADREEMLISLKKELESSDETIFVMKELSRLRYFLRQGRLRNLERSCISDAISNLERMLQRYINENFYLTDTEWNSILPKVDDIYN